VRRFWRIDSLSWGWGLVPLGGEAADDLESGRVSWGGDSLEKVWKGHGEYSLSEL